MGDTTTQEIKNARTQAYRQKPFKYTDTQSLDIQAYQPANTQISGWTGGCRHTTSTYRHASMQPAAWAYSHKSIQGYIRWHPGIQAYAGTQENILKTLKKRKHTDIRTHRHSSKQASIREHAHYYSSAYGRVHLLRHIINQNSYSVLQRAQHIPQIKHLSVQTHR